MKNIAILLCLSMLTACGGGRSAPQFYTLQPGAIEPLSCRAQAGIKIYEPNSSPGLESFRIRVLDRPNHQTTYRGVAWTTTAPRLVQSYLTDAFEKSGMFTNVSTDNDSINATWIVETRLRGLHVDQTGPHPVAVTQMTVTLLMASDRRPVVTVPLERRDDVTGMSMDGIIGTMNSQLDGLTNDMLQHFRKHMGCN